MFLSLVSLIAFMFMSSCSDGMGVVIKGSDKLIVEENSNETGELSVNISSSARFVTNLDPIPVKIEFNKEVSDFELSDITIYGATALLLEGEGSVYRVDLVPDDDGLISVDIAAAVASSQDGDTNIASPQFIIISDRSRPKPNISSTASGSSSLSLIPVTIEFEKK